MDRSEYRTTRIILFLLPLTGAMLALVATSRHGIGLTPDSINFIAAVRGLGEGRGLVNYDGSPFVLWPPLYPWLLAALHSLGPSIETSARWLAALIAGVNVALSLALARSWLRGDHVRIAYGFAVLLSVQLFNAGVLLGTDQAFTTLLLAFLLLAERSGRNAGWGRVLLLALIAAAATLQRLIGVTLIGFGGVLLLLRPVEDWGKRIAKTVVFGAVSGLPLLLWVLRNLRLTGRFTGERFPAELGFFSNTSLLLERLSSWLLPPQLPVLLRILLFVTLLLLFAVVLGQRRREPGGEGEARIATLLTPGWLLAFAAIYLLFLVVTSSLVLYNALDDRFLSPLYPALVLLLFVGVGRVARDRWITGRQATWARVGIAVLLVGWLSYSGARVVKYLRVYLSHGIIDYTTDAWANSGLLMEIASLPPSHPLISNAPDAIWYFTGRQAGMTPRIRFGTRALVEQLKADSTLDLAWFGNVRRSYLIPPAMLGEDLKLDTLRILDDGVLYSLRLPQQNGEARP